MKPGDRVHIISKSIGSKTMTLELQDQLSKGRAFSIQDVYPPGSKDHEESMKMPWVIFKDEPIYVINGDYFAAMDIVPAQHASNYSFLNVFTKKEVL
jgi:hypothetical protein